MIPNLDRATGRQPWPAEHRLRGVWVSETKMVDNFEEPNPPRASHDDTDRGADAEMTGYAEPRPFAVRLRMIILLSLICWMLVIAAVAWIVG